MARLDWSRLHSKILRSSIWLEGPIIRLVWICALADSETDGTFYGSYEVLSRAWNLPEKDIRLAMERLCSPDPKSSTKENEGRRIIREDDNSWRVLNKRLYNPSGEPQGASTPRVQKFRHKERLETEATGNDSNGGNALDKSREELEENKTEQSTPEQGSAPPKRFVPPKVEEVVAYASEKGLYLDAGYFVDFFEAKGWVTGKTKMREWRAAARNAARDGWTIRQGANAQVPASEKPMHPEDEIYRDNLARTRAEVAEEIRLRKEKGLD